MTVTYGEKVRSNGRTLLLHDEVGGNKLLCGRVHRQGQALQGVGPQQRRGLVLSKHDQGDLTPSPVSVSIWDEDHCLRSVDCAQLFRRTWSAIGENPGIQQVV